MKLQKIILNLLSNAIKFTPAGHHVWYSIKDEPVGVPDPYIVFTIRDEGIGMSKEYQQKLYTPFAQENREGYESQGTGLWQKTCISWQENGCSDVQKCLSAGMNSHVTKPISPDILYRELLKFIK